MSHTYGIFLYPKVAALDFVGPYDVFSLSNMLTQSGQVVTIAESREPLVCANGMTITPDYDFASAPEVDILLIPGAESPTNVMESEISMQWIRQQANQVQQVAMVCTGALIAQQAGLLKGKKATTHWMAIEALEKDPDVEAKADCRYVRDGKVITSQGISAGIDMSLWLVGELHSPDHAREVRKMLQYDPAPPYSAEV